MRMLLQVQMDTEAANQAIRDGSWSQTMGRMMEELHPEAAYFTAFGGKRTGYIVFDLKEPSDIPSIAEPFFMGVKADIHMAPCMTVDDVAAGLEKAAAAFAPA